MSPPQQLRQQTSNCSLLLIYRPQKDEKLSWPSGLTYSGWLTHISGHPSATSRAQDTKAHRPKTNALPLDHATTPRLGIRWSQLKCKSISFRLCVSNQLDLDLQHNQSKSTHSTAKYTMNNYLFMSLYIKHQIGRKVLVLFGV